MEVSLKFVKKVRMCSTYCVSPVLFSAVSFRFDLTIDMRFVVID